MLKIIFTILILVFTELKMEDLCFEDQKTATCFMIVTQVSGIPASSSSLHTGKSLSEALIFASTNPQYDDRLSMELLSNY